MRKVFPCKELDLYCETGQICRLIDQTGPGGNLTLVALGDGAFTISNLGSIRVDQFTVIINAPQAAILAERNITLPLFRFLLTIIINV